MSNSAFQPSILTVTQASSSGSGQGEVNVVTNPSAATDLTKWTATGFTAARATSGSPLDPVVPTGFVLTPQAIGNTFTSEALTVPSTLRNRKLKLEFYYTQASAAWKVDVLNSSDTRFTLTTDSSITGSAIPASASGGKFVTYFDMDSGSTVKVRFTSTAASGAISVTQVIVGPGIQPQGAVVGEWQDYTLPGNPTSVTTSSKTGFWRRVGDTIEIRARIILSSAVPASPSGGFSYAAPSYLPSGLSVNSTKLNASTGTVVGSWYGNDANGASTADEVGGAAYVSNDGTLSLVGGAANTDIVDDTFPWTWATGDGILFSIAIPVSQWAGSGTVQLAQNDVEFASNNSTWDSDVNNTTAFVYGPAGNQFGGALTLGRVKRVRFQTPIQADSVLVIEGSDDRTTWFPLANAQIGGVQISASRSTSGTGDTSSGVYYRTVANSNTDIDVFFFRYAALANDDTPASDWPATGYWRVRKSSAGAAVGFGIVQPGVSSGLVSASGLPGNTSGNAVAAGYIGERVHASTLNNSGGLSSTSNFNDIQSITLNKGVWLVTSIIDADNAASCTGHFNAISLNSGNTVTDHIRGVNQIVTSVPANSNATTCIANYYMIIAADNTPVRQKGKAVGAVTTCSAIIQAMRIA